MTSIKVLLVGLVLATILVSTLEARETCSSHRPIRRVYVIRRRLRFSPISYCHMSHSALVLEMTDGKQCLLEYLVDGRAHVYDARPKRTFRCWFKRCYIIQMPDNKNRNYYWFRELNGVPLPRRLGPITPQKAKLKMQRLMGTHYNLLKNNCHHAQQKLRKAWGLYVHAPYENPKSFCSCLSRIPWYIVPRPLVNLFVASKALCKEATSG